MSSKIILNAMDPVTCPHCDTPFPVKDGLSHQLIEKYEDEYQAMLAKEREELGKSLEKDLERKVTRSFEAKLAEVQSELEESRLEAERQKKLTDKAKAKAAEQAREEAEAEAEQLKTELLQNSEKLKKYRDQELELRRENKEIE